MMKNITYSDFLVTLSVASYDKVHKISLIEDDEESHRVYNFDKVTEKLCKGLRGEKNFSCDAYFVKNNENTFLIEFKNQAEGNINRVKLKNKIYDGIMTIAMIDNLTPQEVADRTSVIVVYNNSQTTVNDDYSYSTSEAIAKLSNKLARLSKRENLDVYEKKFNLLNGKGILFKNVYTVDKAEFEKVFINYLFKE